MASPRPVIGGAGAEIPGVQMAADEHDLFRMLTYL